jgi:hypothetical protein
MTSDEVPKVISGLLTTDYRVLQRILTLRQMGWVTRLGPFKESRTVVMLAFLRVPATLAVTATLLLTLIIFVVMGPLSFL